MRNRGWIAFITIITVLVFACGQSQSPNQLWNKAKQLSQEENYSEAIDIYESILDMEAVSDTVLAKTHFTLADLYLNQEKKYQQALNYYREVTENYSASLWGPKAQFMIGYVYANHIHNYKEAEKEYQRFLDIYPTHELVNAVNFELKYLGEDLDQIKNLDFLQSSDASAAQEMDNEQ